LEIKQTISEKRELIWRKEIADGAIFDQFLNDRHTL